ncbi:MAG: hypothetical protein HY613_10155 [Candidatus Rokubacteria bacterium]|nr:hypothetical protein [Candidatus Rokubacteria bacterium]
MLTVTDRAKQELRGIVSRRIRKPGISLRLVRSAPAHFGLVPDVEKKGDHVVTHEGASVLLIGKGLSGLLGGVTIDCRETPDGAQLVLSRRA